MTRRTIVWNAGPENTHQKLRPSLAARVCFAEPANTSPRPATPTRPHASRVLQESTLRNVALSARIRARAVPLKDTPRQSQQMHPLHVCHVVAIRTPPRPVPAPPRASATQVMCKMAVHGALLVRPEPTSHSACVWIAAQESTREMWLPALTCVWLARRTVTAQRRAPLTRSANATLGSQDLAASTAQHAQRGHTKPQRGARRAARANQTSTQRQ